MRIFFALLFLLTSHVSLAAADVATATSSDPFFPRQWSLNNDGSQTIDINFDDSHTISQKAVAGVDIGWLAAKKQILTMAKNPVIVAVIDSGLDTTHPDLAGRVLPDGWDFLDSQGKVTDPTGHGTGLAGIIAANIDNGIGISGIAPGSVKILSLRVISNSFVNFRYNGNGKLMSDYVADGINYAVAHGANILNLSMVWPKLTDTDNIRKAVQGAIKAGVLLVAAAGNEKREHVTFPCAYDGVLCVGAITNNGDMALYSNYGGMVDVLAPGDDIISLFPTGLQSPDLRIKGYENQTGTSESAPIVAGIAAVLKSVYPQISVSEIKARILASAAKPPFVGASLYGLANIKRALNVQPQTVYLPSFKALDDAVVNENNLTASSVVTVENLWKAAGAVKARILIGGKVAGSVYVPAVAPGGKLNVPWKYKFQSLDDSADLRLTLQISDGSGISKEFSYNLTAVRAMENMPRAMTLAVPGVKADDWFGDNNGHTYSKLYTVDSYPFEVGVQRYYLQTASTPKGATVTIFDPTATTPLNTVTVPYIQAVRQIIRLDVNGDGKRDWVITGQGKNAAGKDFFQFYFLNENFQPLKGDTVASTWQIFDGAGQNILRNFASPGSWIQLDGKLVPSFMGKGLLPPGDNFRELDVRFFTPDSHLFYLAPQAPVSSNPSLLQVHALDNAKFRTQYPNIFLQNIIPGTASEMSKGTLRLLVQTGSSLASSVNTWNINSVGDFNLQPASGWDAFSAAGQVNWAQSTSVSQNSSVLSGFIDDHRGTLAWSTNQGQFIGRSDYGYSSAANPLINLTGAFDLGTWGRYWFVETGFDLVGFHQDAGNNITSQHLPLERDSSWPNSQFSQILTAVIAGSTQVPLPGVLYTDSNLVRKNQIFLTDLNTKSGALERPLRYSLRIPDACLVMNPIRPQSSTQSLLAFPMLCQKNSNVSFSVVNP